MTSVKVTEYQVTDESPYSLVFVQYLGAGKWIVSDTRDGSPRAYYNMRGELTMRAEPQGWDQWIAETRFTEQEALELAHRIVPGLPARLLAAFHVQRNQE